MKGNQTRGKRSGRLRTKNSQETHTPPPVAALSPRKKRAFFLLMLAFPFLAVAFLELGLRAIHYGPDLSLFTTEVIHGTEYYTMNPYLKARYFSRNAFTPSASPDYFRMPKPPATFRIFCLGGSTTVGYPFWYNVSFSSFLRDRLRRTFPQRRIEVINLGMTATNSFTVLDLANELPAYEPDLLIIYDGHNEFYGALGVASRETAGGTRWLSMLYLQLIHSRTFLLLRDGYNGLRSLISGTPEQPIHGITMELLARGKYIPYRSPLYLEAEQTFQANLEELRSICRETHIPVILASQVSNLQGQPPLVSAESPGLSAETKRAFTALFEAGKKAWDERRWQAALEEFRAAAALDSLHAGTRFAIARCLDVLGQKHEARLEYVKARDFDQLRFRTSSDFNRLIMQMADSTTAAAVDMEQLFMAYSADSLIGNEFILDHLHPNSFGYFLMAKGYAATMARRGILATPEEWAQHDVVPDSILWDERPVTDVDERIATRRVEMTASSWPFTSDHSSPPDLPAADTLGQIAEHFTDGTLGWGDAHKSAASYYAHRHDWKNLEQEYKTLINQAPHYVDAYLNLSQLYVDQGRLKDARTILRQSLDEEPTANAYRILGDIALQTGNTDEAITSYDKIRGFHQSPADQAENGYLLALAYMQGNLPDRAESELVRVLTVMPGHKPSSELLKAIRQKQAHQ